MCEFGFDYEYSAYLSTRDDCVDFRDQVREMLLLYDTLGYSAKSAIQEWFPNISLEFQSKFTYVDAEAYGYIEAKRHFLKCDFQTKHWSHKSQDQFTSTK